MCLQADRLISAPAGALGKAEGFKVARVAAAWALLLGELPPLARLNVLSTSDGIFSFNSARVSLGWLRLLSTCQWPPAVATSQVWDGKRAVLAALNVPVATCGVF